jgi:chemotaxis protein MotB
MAEEDENQPKKVKCPECKPGAPLWMATFADMATLLMAFFVLILSFSETKVDKYKAVVGSLTNAFGMPKVQIVPMGTTVIESDFSPSISLPTPVNQMNQEVVDPDKDVPERKESPDNANFDIKSEKRKLEQLLQQEIMDAQVDVKLEGEKLVIELKGENSTGQDQKESDQVKKAGVISPERLGLVAKVSQAQKQINAETVVKIEKDAPQMSESALTTDSPKAKQKLVEELTRDVAEIEEQLKSQLISGKVSVERRDDSVAIIMDEQDTFGFGSAVISKEAVEALKDVRDLIMQRDGTVVVAGHTDNVPVTPGGLYSSNWDLSSARAAAVAHAMTELLGVPESRVEIEAHADTQPVADNATEEGRRKNRRIEILMRPGTTS